MREVNTETVWLSEGKPQDLQIKGMTIRASLQAQLMAHWRVQIAASIGRDAARVIWSRDLVCRQGVVW